MTTVHHTPIASGAAANAATINAPLSEIDTKLGAAKTSGHIIYADASGNLAGGATLYRHPTTGNIIIGDASPTDITGATLQVAGPVVVSDGAGGTVASLSATGLSQYAGLQFSAYKKVTVIAAGAVLFRVTLQAIRRTAVLNVTFVDYSDIGLSATILCNIGSIITSGTVAITYQMQNGAQLRSAVSNDGTNAYFDFYLQSNVPADMATTARNVLIVNTTTAADKQTVVTFPNY